MPIMDHRDFSGRRVGHYLFFNLLGAGASGSVYHAIDVTMQSSPDYAVKCVQKSFNVRRRNQQIAEIRNHDAVILCPHVLRLCGTFEDDKYVFLVFPLCEMDMGRAIFESRVYWKNDDLIKKSFIEILDGVFACHRKGVYHRDLKPENIMCNVEGSRIKISDFGLSTNRRICRDGGCGTTSYMSPECLDERECCYDANQADIWSLGVILFNMVTCRHPWEEARQTDREYMAFLSEKDCLSSTSPISESLSVLLHRIWHPTPMKRMSIPAIRQAVLEMDTFYRPRRSTSCSPSPVSKDVTLVDSEQTCVATDQDEKEKKKATSLAAVDNMENAFRRLELMIQ